MPDRLIQRLEKEGRLRKQKVGLVQIDALLRQSILDLEEAKKIVHLAERATYVLAYMAMLKAGRALLLMKGYMPVDGAQHKTVVEVVSEVLGDKDKNLTANFETMRRKRNDITYGAGELITMSKARKAFDDAIALVKQILSEVKFQNPQLELEFGL